MTRLPSSRVERRASDPGGEPDDADAGDALKPKTSALLVDLASESFKRQADLDEAVWRSLPFFAATLAIAAALIGAEGKDVPPFAVAPLPMVLHTLLIAGTASFAWALRWFWTVVRPRNYEYPAADDAVRAYAEQITVFWHGRGVTADALDDAVVGDLQLFMVDQYGNAARTNFAHNAAKMKARSRVLLFMMIGFVLAFACEATMFVDRKLVSHHEKGSRGGSAGSSLRSPPAVAKPVAAAPGAAPPPPSQGRRAVLGMEREAGHLGQTMSRKPTIPTTPISAAPTRPTPPAPQFLAKLNQFEQAGTYRPDADFPPPKKKD